MSGYYLRMYCFHDLLTKFLYIFICVYSAITIRLQIWAEAMALCSQ